AIHALARERIDTDPLELELRVLAQQRLHARNDALGLLLLVWIGIPAELEIDSPDVVGLHVQKDRLIAMERWIEPEPALGGEVGLHPHVGDQEAVAEHLPPDLPTQRRAHR